MSKHDARDAQTPEEVAKRTARRGLPKWVRNQLPETVLAYFHDELSRALREATDAAHAAGKAEGAAEERERAARILDARAAKLNDPHCSVAATLRKLSSNIRSEGGESDG